MIIYGNCKYSVTGSVPYEWNGLHYDILRDRHVYKVTCVETGEDLGGYWTINEAMDAIKGR